MAGFGTKGKIPGSPRTPVHGAVNDAMASAQDFLGSTVSPVLRGAADVAGTMGSIPGGVQKGLQDAGNNLFGPKTAIGGALGSIFGGGSEKSAMPSSPAPARPMQQPTSMRSIATPTATARPLVMGSPTVTPAAPSGGGVAKSRGAKATKRRKQNK